MAIAVVKSNPIRVTGTTDVSAKIITPREAIFIRRIHWFNPTTAGDLLTLKTAKGDYIVELRCDADGVSKTFDMELYYDDIYCTDMDSGTLYIYTK